MRAISADHRALPPVDLRPPFNITRASHVRVAVADLEKSRDFYKLILGLVVSDEDDSTCYLRGVAEACHHSLVLERAQEPGTSRRIGFRVLLEEDLDVAYRQFAAHDLKTEWVDEPHQGRTLHVNDPLGTPLELCATMELRPRMYRAVEKFTGAQAQQFDHVQILAPDPYALCAFYGDLGFRNSEYIADGDDRLVAGFMYRKDTCFDLAVVEGAGPRLHHFAYTVPETRDIFTACDIAGNYGYGDAVERGPGRHGPGGMLFVYLRDPDGHRVELFINHYLAVDLETQPVRWDASSLGTNVRWGLPGPERWYLEASDFAGVPVIAPAHVPEPLTLERYLLQQRRR